jgi:hypothetical protein
MNADPMPVRTSIQDGHLVVEAIENESPLAVAGQLELGRHIVVVH